ncbi:organic cation transporter protein-like [Asterias amurensis]|uniref:organic cation transporter protein-like n=1 Tax=Asterias amurensis TaxID=7602 RepID=UPI003AB19483
MKFDDILVEIGVFGKYQKVLGVLLYLCAIPLSEHAIAQVFLAAKTDHWCTVPDSQSLNCSSLESDCLELQKELTLPFTVDEDGNTVYSECERYLNARSSLDQGVSNLTDGQDDGWANETIACDAGWEYDRSQYKTTVIQDFDLVCAKGDMSGFAQSVFFAGFLSGSLIWGAVADWAGRRPTFFVCVTMSLVSATSVSFMPNFASFAAMRFFVAAGNYGIYLMAFILVSEIVGPEYRVQVGTMLSVLFALGYVLLSLLAYLLREWRHLQLALSLPISIFLLYFIFLPESPRWLISKKRYKEAKMVIDKIAEVNGTQVPENLFDDPEDHDEKEKTSESSTSRQPTHIDLFRTPNMRKKTLNLLYNWFVSGFVYYGLSLSTSSLGIDPYIAAFVSGTVDFPAFFSSWYFMQRFGRRISVCCYLGIAGLACLITSCISPGVGRAVVAMIGKFGIAGSFNAIYTLSVELYPTPIRTIGVGLSSMSARISGTLAPVILLLGKFWEPLPLVIFGTSAVVAGALTLLLPETLNQPLPETIEEGEIFGKGQSFYLMTPKESCKPEPSSSDTKYKHIPDEEHTQV